MKSAPTLAVVNFRIHQITLHDPEIPEGLDNYTKKEVRNVILRPPHNHLTPATCIVDINEFC